MIRVRQAAEPDSFEERVRTPGLRAIAEMVGEKPKRSAGPRHKKIASKREDIPSVVFPAYWTNALDDLMNAYDEICAYCCFRIHKVTGWRSADHFAPKSRTWDKVYEWNNYRLTCGLINSRKRDFGDVLDPFEIEDGWFELELVGFQVIPNRALSAKDRQKVQETIDRLGLNKFCRSRAQDAEEYWSREVTYQKLKRESPFVANELRRQKRLHPGDV